MIFFFTEVLLKYHCHTPHYCESMVTYAKQHTHHILEEERWTGFSTLLPSGKLCKIRISVIHRGRCDVWCLMRACSSSCPISGYCWSTQHSSSFLSRESNRIRKGGHSDPEQRMIFQTHLVYLSCNASRVKMCLQY